MVKKTLIQFFAAIALLTLFFFFAYLSRTPVEENIQKRTHQEASDFIVSNTDDERIAPNEEIYGFAIGNFHKAYYASNFLEVDQIHDIIAGENVILRRTGSGDVVMIHSETGEVFIPVKTVWSSWVTLYPDTLIYENE
ncbi:MAG: hypothetical protein KAR00_00680 [Candidatus Pacebacteria bacterium]|nr:hypothetical protein [Candidatus Paceibacterota bacterium]